MGVGSSLEVPRGLPMGCEGPPVTALSARQARLAVPLPFLAWRAQLPSQCPQCLANAGQSLCTKRREARLLPCAALRAQPLKRNAKSSESP